MDLKSQKNTDKMESKPLDTSSMEAGQSSHKKQYLEPRMEMGSISQTENDDLLDSGCKKREAMQKTSQNFHKTRMTIGVSDKGQVELPRSSVESMQNHSAQRSSKVALHLKEDSLQTIPYQEQQDLVVNLVKSYQAKPLLNSKVPKVRISRVASQSQLPGSTYLNKIASQNHGKKSGNGNHPHFKNIDQWIEKAQASRARMQKEQQSKTRSPAANAN